MGRRTSSRALPRSPSPPIEESPASMHGKCGAFRRCQPCFSLRQQDKWGSCNGDLPPSCQATAQKPLTSLRDYVIDGAAPVGRRNRHASMAILPRIPPRSSIRFPEKQATGSCRPLVREHPLVQKILPNRCICRESDYTHTRGIAIERLNGGPDLPSILAREAS